MIRSVVLSSEAERLGDTRKNSTLPVRGGDVAVGRERLLAKSARERHPGQEIRVHTAAVIRAGESLVEATGKAQLGALGLDPSSWLERFRREIKLAALLHDLGKANDHFQEMIQGETTRRQGLRHEAVSYWIARRPEVRDWVRPVQADSRAVELILWAIAGHHRKFPPTDPPEDAKPELTVYLRHPDFREVLELGVAELGLATPPNFSSDGRLRLTRIGSVLREFDDAQEEAEDLMSSLSDEEVRYVALLKACLICADVAGSIERRGTESLADWIVKAFRRVPTVAELESIVSKRLNGKPLRRFQLDVAERSDRVVFVQAGCGSGKTSAAYLWAARQAPWQRLFFCYPTTGTATEGFRDYLLDPALDAKLIHGRAEVDMEILGLGDEEPGFDDPDPRGPSDRAATDSAGALEQWSTPIVSCTVDTVLGLVQNNRRGIFAWPSLSGGVHLRRNPLIR